MRQFGANGNQRIWDSREPTDEFKNTLQLCIQHEILLETLPEICAGILEDPSFSNFISEVENMLIDKKWTVHVDEYTQNSNRGSKFVHQVASFSEISCFFKLLPELNALNVLR